MKPSDKLRELGFGNQAVIVGTRRKELFGVVDKMFEEITSIKKWLKGRNIPTETKDELRRRLNKIGG